MSFDVTTLALAKSYADQHGGGGGDGASTAEKISYTNTDLPDVANVKTALDKVVKEQRGHGTDIEVVNDMLVTLHKKSHSHNNKDTLDKLSVLNGKLQYNGSDVGLKGDKGAAGKSAYQYAQDGGYTGTETEFSEKLAQEQLTGITNELTPIQVYEAVSAGIPVKVQCLHDVYGLLSFTAFNIAESFDLIVSQTIVYNNNVYILAELNGNIQAGNWVTKFTVLAEKTDIPTALPNPNAITFTGAVTGSYDGSAAMAVNIPSAVTDDHINSLIDTKLGVIENGSY